LAGWPGGLFGCLTLHYRAKLNLWVTGLWPRGLADGEVIGRWGNFVKQGSWSADDISVGISDLEYSLPPYDDLNHFPLHDALSSFLVRVVWNLLAWCDPGAGAGQSPRSDLFLIYLIWYQWEPDWVEARRPDAGRSQ